jgi:hypothetical protein
VKDFSLTKNTHTCYNTYRFTIQSIKQIEEQVYHIWWDHDRENRKPIKVGFNLGLVIEHPKQDSQRRYTRADYTTSKSEFQESFHDVCVVDNKSSLKSFMKMISDKINGFAEKSVSKASSLSRYIAIYEILIVCYKVISTGTSEDIKKHIAKRYIINCIHPKYNSCLFGVIYKAIHPNAAGNGLNKGATEYHIEFKIEEFEEFKLTYKNEKHKHVREAFLEQYAGIEIISNIDKIINFLKMKSNNKITSIQFFVENDNKEKMKQIINTMNFTVMMI